MAKQIFAANRLTGGVSGSLDDISYTALEDGNIAIAIQGSDNKTYTYKYNASNNNTTNPESSPDVIIPDDNSTGTGAWILEGYVGATLDSQGTLTVDGTSTLTGNVSAAGDVGVTGSLTAADLQLGGVGATADEISTDETLAGNSDTAVPTEQATKQYVDQNMPSKANLLINGNFDIWQRATTHAVNGYGSADRWYNELGTVSGTFTQQSFTLGQTDVPNNPEFYLQYVTSGAAGTGGYAIIEQRIESVESGAGGDITISFWAKSAGGSDMSITALQNFGTGGSPSSSVRTLGQKITTTTSWARYSTTITLPSVSGKTLGTGDDDFLAIELWCSAGTSFNADTDSLGSQADTFSIAQAKVELGSVATPYVPRLVAEEEAMCERYYQRGNYQVRIGATSTAVTTYDTIQFAGRMRYTPSMTNGTVTYYGNNNSLTFGAVNRVRAVVNLGTSGGGATVVGCAFPWYADAEL